MAAHRTEQVDFGADGSMSLHVWTPDGASGPGPSVLLIQEIFGVGPYIRSVAERLAAAGYVVGAPDVFWRFHPNWESGHDEAGLAESISMVQKLDFPAATADCAAALDALGTIAGGGAPAVLGFCLGGTLAWSVAVAGEPAACVSYYGSGVPDMIGMIDKVHCPTLFHFGNADSFIPNEGVDRIAAAIAGKSGFVLNVENAGHAFDNHEAPMFHDPAAADAAWSKTMAFLGEHVPVT